MMTRASYHFHYTWSLWSVKLVSAALHHHSYTSNYPPATANPLVALFQMSIIFKTYINFVDCIQHYQLYVNKVTPVWYEIRPQLAYRTLGLLQTKHPRKLVNDLGCLRLAFHSCSLFLRSHITSALLHCARASHLCAMNLRTINTRITHLCCK